jgi:mycofactocin glycosyltransferase
MARIVDDLVPVGFKLRADAATRLLPGGARLSGGAVLVGGSPVRVLRLTAGGARQVAGWLEGAPVPDSVSARTLARRLLDAGIAHPDFSVITARGDEVAGGHGEVAGGHGEVAGGHGGVAGGHGEVAGGHGEVAGGHGGAAGGCGGAAGGHGGADAGQSGAAGGAIGPADVTVVVPVRDRRDELARCLAGLREAAGPVIVVDDCSADPAAIAGIAARAGARVVRRPVNGGPGAARNTGLAAAATPVVAFLDSDCVPAPGWLDALLPHFADPATGAVAPRIVPHDAGADRGGRSWLARYEGASSTLDMGARPSIVRPGARVSYVPGAALAVRRRAAGAGFQAGMHVGEDVDFVWRLATAGWRVRYEPAAVMAHQHRVRLGAWFSRRVDYGTSAAILEELHPGDVRPMYASWWTVGAWAAALAVRPRGAGMAAAAGITATATALLARKLSRVTGEAVAWPLAARLAGGGTLAAARPLGSALSRTWWPAAIPLAVAIPRLRLPVAALMITPPLLDWAARRPPLDPVRYAGARLLDDAAYGVGVWTGCARRRQFRALRPVIGTRPPRRPSSP